MGPDPEEDTSLSRPKSQPSPDLENLRPEGRVAIATREVRGPAASAAARSASQVTNRVRADTETETETLWAPTPLLPCVLPRS